MNTLVNTHLTHRLNQDPASGSYQGKDGVERLELRIDLENRMVSGDFFHIDDQQSNFICSFRSNGIKREDKPGGRSLTGLASINSDNTILQFEIFIPAPSALNHLAQVIAKFIFTNNITRSFLCQFQSQFFRTVEFEMDVVATEDPPAVFDLERTLLDGTTHLTISSAYRKAGIDLSLGGEPTRIQLRENQDLKWSVAELHAAMEQHFSLLKEGPQWKLWLLVATFSEIKPLDNRGLMFDRKGKERQGCVVFYELVKSDMQRGQLRTFVHEIGHCFNLLHSGEKRIKGIPTSRKESLSWMNFPKVVTGGEPAFWDQFQFEFDPLELQHLHHGYYPDVVMGGNNLGIGAGDVIELKEAQFHPLLQLEIQTPKVSLKFSEPVFIELKLTPTRPNIRAVPFLHPREGVVKIFIEKPSGQIALYKTQETTCSELPLESLTPDNPAQELAYIGYGKDGFYFDQPGTYHVQAIYFGPDGVIVPSNLIKLKVNTLLDEDKDVTALFAGEPQGWLLYLNGSDSNPNGDAYMQFLDTGNVDFQKILFTHGDHPLAMYVRFAFGVNAQRNFKTITAENKITVRKAENEKSFELLFKFYLWWEKEALIGILLSKMVARLILRSLIESQDHLSQLLPVRMMRSLFLSSLKVLLLSFTNDHVLIDKIMAEVDHFQHPFTFWFPNDPDPQ